MEKVNNKIYTNSGNPNVFRLINGENLRILDIGCGAGDNAKILKQMGHAIDGITLSEAEKRTAQQFCEEVYIHNLENGLPEKFKNKHYDLIICSHVLEHIAFPDQLMTDIFETSKNADSKIIILLPNLMYYKTRFNILFGNFDYSKDDIMDYTHLRWYTQKSALAMFKNHGFQVITVKVDGYLPFYRLFKPLGSVFNTTMKTILFKIGPRFFGSEMIFLIKPTT